MHITDLTSSELSGKRVLLRLDLNLPVVEGIVTDMTRLERSLPTINHIVENGGRAVILSHLGRPGGSADPNLSFAALLEQIRAKIGHECRLLEHRGELPLPELNQEQTDAKVLLVDNTRFFPGEKTGDAALALALSQLGDLFCIDAFSVAHRAHASVSGINAFLPSYLGPSIANELENLAASLDQADHPIVAIVGGAKVSTKIGVLTNLLQKVDHLIVGGGMANTFLAAMGQSVGNSIYEADYESAASDIIAKARQQSCHLYLPTDVATHTEFSATTSPRLRLVDTIPDDEMILDFGPTSTQEIQEIILGAKTVIWNGPLGAFELSPFDTASRAVARTAAESCTQSGARVIAGGGDTLALLGQCGVIDQLTFCSTAGGAFLEWLEGKQLPGLTAVA